VEWRSETSEDAVLASARAGDERAFAQLVSPFRRELKAHCYRMCGSIHDAEDLLQDSLLRAWRGLGAFEGRSSLRTWLHRIATNACLNDLASKKTRSLPADLGPAGDADDPIELRLEPIWLEPCPEDLYAKSADPEARYDARESVALAFLSALQRLPPKQRALLLLHDVLGWKAAECAELLELSVAAVNSALQRARQAVEGKHVIDEQPPRVLLERYIRAWEDADVGALVSLLHEEATLSMPPIPLWLSGVAALEKSMRAMVFVPGARFRLVEIAANGRPALALYRSDASGDDLPYAIQLLEWDGERIRTILAFLDVSLFEPFGLSQLSARAQ
jgi:RNA polymerase sigma-70 factor (TIGR02960 family)